jgi:hypothetical protein
MAVAMPETLVRPLRQTVGGDIDPSCADELVEMAQQCSAVLIGSGLMDVEVARELVGAVLPKLDTLVVLDALALAYLGQQPDGAHHLGGRVVLTPNRHELALTLGRDDDEVDDDPAAATAELAARCRAVVSCGGSRSHVADPEGNSWVDETGGAGLGVAGSGDVMAGHSDRARCPWRRARTGRGVGCARARAGRRPARRERRATRVPGARGADRDTSGARRAGRLAARQPSWRLRGPELTLLRAVAPRRAAGQPAPAERHGASPAGYRLAALVDDHGGSAHQQGTVLAHEDTDLRLAGHEPSHTPLAYVASTCWRAGT